MAGWDATLQIIEGWSVGSSQFACGRTYRPHAICMHQERILVLSGFVKKSQKTPDEELSRALRRMREFVRQERVMTELRKSDDFSTLDDFLAEEGKLEAFQAVAIKEVLAWQIEEAMKAEKLSRKKMAEKMGTSRSQVSRLLDPKDGNVTLATLQRAAEVVGRKVRIELV